LNDLPNSIFVDCTSSENVAGFYETIFSENISVVTPNKKSEFWKFHRLSELEDCSEKGREVFVRNKCGCRASGDQHTQRLLLSGDRVIRIEAC